MHVDELFLGRGPGSSFVRIARQEFAQRQATAHDALARDQLLARARNLAAAARARGKHPVDTPQGDGAASPFASAWSKVVKVVPQVDPVCGQFVLTANNASYPVNGTARYYDSKILAYTPIQAAGYAAKLETIVEMENLCNEVIYRPRWWYATTAAGGAFSFPSVATAEPAGSWDPANRFTITTSEVGEWTSGVSFSPVDHVLNADAHQFSWVGGAAIINPEFRPANAPYRFMFRWNDMLASLREFWCGAGLCQFVNFRAAYWDDYNPEHPELEDYAHFESSAPPGLVMFYNATWVRPFVMAHEFGHAFHYELQGQVAFPTTGPHSYCTQQDELTAIVEGFADWHAIKSTEDSGGILTCWLGECHQCDELGWRRKTNVSAFFWDIFDSTNSASWDLGVDTIEYPLSLLANWRSGSCYGSFDDFYQNFASRSLWTIGGTDTLRTVNHVTTP
jgi:hypothetical protein